jgi:hypothetical protein
MSVSAEEGPQITFGAAQSPPNASNPELGPNAWFAGDMILDPRGPMTYQPGNRGGAAVFGWPTIGGIPIIDQVPVTASASNIASATPVSGTALTLASASVAGVTIGCSVINANTGVSVTGLLGLDVATTRTVTGTFTNGSPKITFTGVVMLGVQVNDQLTFTSSGTLPGGFALLTTYYIVAIGATAMMVSATPGGAPISASTAGSGTQTINVTAPSTYDTAPNTPFQPPVVFGSGGAGAGGPMRYWNPAWALSRCIGITSNGDDTGGSYTIRGYDPYGYPLTQTITGLSSGQAVTTKAFKYIASVTPNGTINSTTLTVGTLDVFGLPLRTDWVPYLTVYWNSLLVAPASVALVTADINTPSATTGDVRGTITATATSDGTKRLYVFWNPQAANIGGGGQTIAQITAGLLGQPQF